MNYVPPPPPDDSDATRSSGNMSTKTLVKSFIKNDLMELATGKPKHSKHNPPSSSSQMQYSYPLPDHGWQQQQQHSYYQNPPPPPPPPQQQQQVWPQQQPQPNYGGGHPAPPPYSPIPPQTYPQQQQQGPYQQQQQPPYQQQQHPPYQQQPASFSPYPPPQPAAVPPPQLQTPCTLSLTPSPSDRRLLLVAPTGGPPVYSIRVGRSSKLNLALLPPSGQGHPIATADLSSSSRCDLVVRGQPVPCKKSDLSSSFKFEPPGFRGKLKWEEDDWSTSRLNCRDSALEKVARAKGGKEIEIRVRVESGAALEAMILVMLVSWRKRKGEEEFWEKMEEGLEDGGGEGGEGDDGGEGAEVVSQVIQALAGAG